MGRVIFSKLFLLLLGFTIMDVLCVLCDGWLVA